MPKLITVQIVTKKYLVDRIAKDPAWVIGRILVAIFNRQTSEEASNNLTKFHNGVGFSSNDARLGCIGAKYFIKHGTLTDGLMKGWLKLDKHGFPRITKYAQQLNDIAMTKTANEQNEINNHHPHGVP